ncbi:prohibitin [Perkinsela sp. CCAP 1560/4]|nr:prohibitin [Perkinsela sp. CCAP 1560/4]|eukprot:KNH09756.1 prohibitin [Perkinsela sp. CCAP 1560/4]
MECDGFSTKQGLYHTALDSLKDPVENLIPLWSRCRVVDQLSLGPVEKVFAEKCLLFQTKRWFKNKIIQRISFDKHFTFIFFYSMCKPPAPDFQKLFNQAWNTFRKNIPQQPPSYNGPKMPSMVMGPTLAAVIIGGGAYTLYKSMYFVPGGHRAVKFNALFGLYDRSYGEGAHIAIPYIEIPIFFDIRAKPTEVVTSTGSRDLQIINVSVRVLYRPNVGKLAQLYRQLGLRYAETALPSVINEVIKSVVAQYNASELLTRRPEVSKQIALALTQRSAAFHIDISDVAITNMTFGKEYTAAIESKQIAQQMAERAKFQVDQAIQEKRSMIVLAEGEAESAQMIGDAIKSQPGFLEMRRVEAARVIARAISNMDGNNKVLFDSDTLLIGSALQPSSAVKGTN